jgi:16S rRNA (adenine1518-N6/adenine1519-N6)-dimethyltransferase
MFTANKAFSQNFLVNDFWRQKVLDVWFSLALSKPELPILEIGPGQGHLTKELLKLPNKLICIELDLRSVEFLQKTFPDEIKSGKLDLIYGDATDILPKLEMEDFWHFSSLPYQVGSRIMIDLSFHFPLVTSSVILQKEVVDKVEKSNKLTLFGAWLNLLYSVENSLTLPPQAFYPPPKVYSAILTLKPKENFLSLTNFKDLELKNKFRILKKLFIHPRKSLANNLKELNLDNSQISTFLENNNLEKNTRLIWDNYEQIFEKIIKQNF